MADPAPVRFVMIGGFLGAGKTTTLKLLAERLAAQGRRVALLTNDDVDTAEARLHGLPVREVAGGCFCARFSDLVANLDALLDALQPDVMLAEPVGSCADLTATVLQPLRQYYGDRLQLAPYSILVDPDRAAELLEPPLSASPVGYLFHKQLEEADLLVLNKLDRLTPEQRVVEVARLSTELPATEVVGMSALTGEGVDTWWARITADGPVGGRLLELDAARYAAAEAALGLVQALVVVVADEPFDAGALAHDWLRRIRHGVARAVTQVGHVKCLVEAGGAARRLSLTRTAGAIEQTGAVLPAATQATLRCSARVELPPADLELLVVRSLRQAANERRVQPTITRLQSLDPTRAEPAQQLLWPL